MAEREMEMEALNDVEAAKGMAMEQAMIADTREDEMFSIEGDFSTNALNKVVDALNRVNKLFRAPMYPKFDKFEGKLPPEFIKNIEMVNQALNDAGIEDKMFDLQTLESDGDLKLLAGKLDAAAGDRAFKSFLNKPLGMGEIQGEMEVPTTQMSGGSTNVQSSGPVAEDSDELFMARMRT